MCRFLPLYTHVSWNSKKQQTVLCSSSEAEYRALDFVTSELQWISFLLCGLLQHPSRVPVLYCDGQSALHIGSNPVFHEHTSHFDSDCHLVSKTVNARLMRLLTVSSHD